MLYSSINLIRVDNDYINLGKTGRYFCQNRSLSKVAKTVDWYLCFVKHRCSSFLFLFLFFCFVLFCFVLFSSSSFLSCLFASFLFCFCFRERFTQAFNTRWKFTYLEFSTCSTCLHQKESYAVVRIIDLLMTLMTSVRGVHYIRTVTPILGHGSVKVSSFWCKWPPAPGGDTLYLLCPKLWYSPNQ